MGNDDLAEKLNGEDIVISKELVKYQWEKSGNYKVDNKDWGGKFQANMNIMQHLLESNKLFLKKVKYSRLFESDHWKKQEEPLLLHMKFKMHNLDQVHVVSAHKGFIYDSQMECPIDIDDYNGSEVYKLSDTFRMYILREFVKCK